MVCNKENKIVGPGSQPSRNDSQEIQGISQSHSSCGQDDSTEGMDQHHRKIWGRRQGRPLKVNQKRLLAELLPQIQVHVTPDSKLDTTHLFPQPLPLSLEIGFGGGEHLAFQAQGAPEMGFIGCEPFVTGVAGLLGYVEEQSLSNVRIVVDDARILLKSLPDGCLERIYILFPDPWPKKRHNKRRIVSDETIDDLSRTLKSGGELVMATDIADYAEWMQDVLAKRSEFTPDLKGRPNVHTRPDNWLITRYEQKGVNAGRPSAYLYYKKS